MSSQTEPVPAAEAVTSSQNDANLDLSGTGDTAPVVAVDESEGIQDPEFVDSGSQALYDYVVGKQMSFREVVEKYEVVSAVHDPAHGSYVIVAEPAADSRYATEHAMHAKRLANPALVDGISLPEMGYVSPSPFLSWTRTEWNPKLADKQGLREYYKMKRSDGTVRGSLRQLKTPIQSAHWFVEPHSEKTADVNAARFVWENFYCWLNVSWARLIDDVLLMCDYGYMAFEKVWNQPYGPHDIVRDGRLRLQKLAPRHPLDIREWSYDANGGPNGVVMEANPQTPDVGPIPIPIAKMAVFTLEAEGGDLSGISVLRSAWKHYYYKDTLYKIDAIQKERHGIGIPVIKLPPGWSAKDLATADALGRNLRTNDRSHVVLPPLWDLIFAQLGGQPVDCMKSIEHHDKMIAVNILAPFMFEASKADEHDFFLKSTRYIATLICDTFNTHIIPQLIDANFSRVKYPYLRARRIGEWDELRTLSFALRNLVGANIIRPDDALEKSMREEFDLPPMDTATTRFPPTPQAPGGQTGGDAPPTAPEAGPPRQKTSPPVGTPSGTSGQDRSGG